MENKSGPASPFKKISIPLTAVGFILVMLFVIPSALIPEQTQNLINTIYNFMTRDLAWFVFASYIAILGGAFYFSFSKYGRIRLGGRDAKPDYSNFSYIAMNVCSSLAAGVIVFGFTEWMYYVNTPPFQVEPGSVKAYEFASAYGMFHWGITMWPLYVLPGIAIGYLYYNKNSGDFKLSTAMKPLTHKIPWIDKYIDAATVFNMAAGICTTAGLGTPVIAQLYAAVTGNEVTFGLKIGIIVAFMIFIIVFGATPIKKGMAFISRFNIWIGILLLFLVFILGPTSFILNTTWQAIGTNISHIVEMSFFTDSIGKGLLSPDWTIFYIVWYLGIAARSGVWVAKISKGRTFREIMWAVAIWTAGACWVSFGILGNFALNLELSQGIMYSEMVNEIGQAGVISHMLQFLPGTLAFAVGFLLLIFLNIATSATSSVISVALLTSKNLEKDEEPGAGFKVFWIVMCFAIPIAFLLIENATGIQTLTIVKNFTTVMSLPYAVFALLISYGFIKVLRQDMKDGLLDFEEDRKEKGLL